MLRWTFGIVDLRAEHGLNQDQDSGANEPSVLLVQRSLRLCLGQAIAHHLQTQVERSPLLSHPDLQAALTAEQTLLRRGEALRLRRDETTLRYDWAIALRLYPHLPPAANLSRIDFAASLATQLVQAPISLPVQGHAPWQTSPGDRPSGFSPGLEAGADWTISLYKKELLQIELGDRALAQWLASVLQCPLTPASDSSQRGAAKQGANTPLAPAPAQPDLAQQFWMQAAHARSCSFLRQGTQLSLLPTGFVEDLCLDAAHLSEFVGRKDVLLLQSPECPGWALLRACITAQDEWATASDAQRWGIAQRLSQSIWVFDANCRLLHEAQIQPQDRSLVRFWTLAIAAKLLRETLHSLGLSAPQEL